MGLVQSKTASGNSGTTGTVTFTSATTSGNLLVLLVGASKNPGAVSFTLPAGWTQIGTTQDDAIFVEMSVAAYYYTGTSISSVAVTFSTAPSGWNIVAAEFSGFSALDVSNWATVASTTPSVSATTTVNGDLIIGMRYHDVVAGASTLTEASGYTQITSVADAGGWASASLAYTTQATAGSKAYNPTQTAAKDEVLGIVAFEASGGGSTVSANGVSAGASAGAASDQLATPAAGAGTSAQSGQTALATPGAQTGQGTGAAVGALQTAGAQAGAGSGAASALLRVSGVSGGVGGGAATNAPPGAISGGIGSGAAQASVSVLAATVGAGAGTANVLLLAQGVSVGQASGQAISQGQIAPGVALLSDAALATVTLVDARAALVTLTDAIAEGSAA